MKASRKKKTIWILFILSVIFFWGFFRNDKNLISPLARPSLESAVEASVQKNGRYGIFIKNFKTEEEYKLNEDDQFEAGSLYKIYLMSDVLEKIKKGKLSEDLELKEDIPALNRKFNISSDEAELKSGEVILTVKNALEQMITISHNYAALLLLSKVEDANMRPPLKVTAKEVATFFEKLYQGQLIDMEYSQRMLDILSRQKISDRIAKYLPKDIKVAHKTGDIGYFEHDGGIVFSERGDYIIVVLTETESPKVADEQIAQISKAVFEYFSRRIN